MIERWYSYAVFRWTREQNFWALQNSESFEHGKWPPLFVDKDGLFKTDKYDKEQKRWVEVLMQVSSYVEPTIGRWQKKRQAYYEKPRIIILEIKERLETTKEAGEALIDEINTGVVDVDGLSRPARRALNYISGERRRRQTYSEWKKQKAYRQKQDEAISLGGKI